MVDDNKHEANLGRIFQRFNFFLIGTAFLITAYTSVVTSNMFSSEGDCRAIILANAINAVGFYLAIFFTITNYWNVKLLDMTSDDKSPQTYSIKSLIIDMLGDFCHLLWEPLDISRGHPAPHTWLLPIGFAVFWFVLWFIVLKNIWIPIVAGILIPVAYIIIMLIKSFMKREEKSR